MVYSLFYQFNKKATEEISEAVMGVVLSEYKKVFMDILGLEKEPMSIVYSVNQKVSQQFINIMNTCNDIRDDLLEHAYGEIAKKSVVENISLDYLGVNHLYINLAR